MNCNTSLYPDGTNGSGVETIATETAQVTGTEWYTLQGVRIAAPASGMGLLIRVDRLNDGTVTSSKQLF